jgi:hypothetical protein
MSAPNTNAWRDWWKNAVGAAVPWLAGGPNGQAEANAWPALLDYLVGQLVAARYVAYPDKAPSDALSHLGGDRQLAQGPSEANGTFITRLKTAWGNSPITVAAPGLPAAQSGGALSGWALAGTWLQLLEELYWGGFDGGVIVQQNGLAYNLSGALVAGADNHSLLVITPCSQLSVAMTSNVRPPTTATQGRSIPASNSWWQFAESKSANANVSDTDLCNRFAILFPSTSLPSVFYTTGRATFTASSAAVATWSHSFVDTSYLMVPSRPVITDGGPSVSIDVDGTAASKTMTGVTVNASDAFTGWVDVLAFQASATNPLADLHPADLARLQSLIRTWRPNALCTGVYVCTAGKFMGWPVQTQATNTMSAPSIVRVWGE